MEGSKIVAAIFIVAALICGYWNVQAVFFPPGDIAVPRSTAINESAAIRGIEFVSLEAANNDPWYRAMLADTNPVIAPNESYFIGQLPAAKSMIVTAFQNERCYHINGSSVVSVVFWGMNSKPVKWSEFYSGPRWFSLKRISEKEIIFVYDQAIVIVYSFIAAVFFFGLAIIAWQWSLYATRRRGDL